MSEPIKRRGMSGKDVITVGIFSAIYFVINFAFMLLGGLHPLLWILMPGFHRSVHRHPVSHDVRQGAEGRLCPPDGPHHRPHLLCHRAVYRGDPGLLRPGLRPWRNSPGASPITGAWLAIWCPSSCSRWAWWAPRCPSG